MNCIFISHVAKARSKNEMWCGGWSGFSKGLILSEGLSVQIIFFMHSYCQTRVHSQLNNSRGNGHEPIPNPIHYYAAGGLQCQKLVQTPPKVKIKVN